MSAFDTNSANTSTNISLSNTNHTASTTNTSNALARGTTNPATLKSYLEFNLTTPSGFEGFGVCTSAYNVAAMGSSNIIGYETGAISLIINPNQGQILVGNSVVGTVGTKVTTQTVGVAIDRTGGLFHIWVKYIEDNNDWNAIGGAVPGDSNYINVTTLGAGPYLYAYGVTSDSSGVCTVNSDGVATAFLLAGGAPTGFDPWDGAGGATYTLMPQICL